VVGFPLAVWCSVSPPDAQMTPYVAVARIWPARAEARVEANELRPAPAVPPAGDCPDRRFDNFIPIGKAKDSLCSESRDDQIGHLEGK